MYDVIVIGGGISGTSTAYFLASDGVSTLLLEQYDLNTQASGSNSGSLHAQIPFEPFVLAGEQWARGFAPVVKLLAEGIALWRRLPGLVNEDLSVVIKGGVTMATSALAMNALKRKVAVEQEQGLRVDLLTAAELRARAPYLAPNVVGGAFCDIEGSANPFLVAPAIAICARQLGVEIRTHTKVLSIDRSGGVFEVNTDRGKFRATRVVNAAGADAGRIAEMVGLTLEVQGFPIQVTVTERVAPLIGHLVYHTSEKLTLKQRPDGTILIGGGWPAAYDRKGRPVVSGDSLEKNLRVALDAVPALEEIEVVRSWAAVVNGTRDWKPILGSCSAVPGFFIVFVPWLGFTAGPISGRITASLVQGKPAPIDADIEPFLLQ